MLQRSFAADQARFSSNQSLGRALAELDRAVAAGRVEHLKTLNKLKQSLAGMEWPDDALARLARSVISTIEAREQLIRQRYTRDIKADTGLRSIYQLFEGATP